MEASDSKIVRWYKGRNIFITGGTGFMGKVLVEKLLYSCTGIGNLYILMRSKRGKSPQQRVEEMWKLPMFDRLRGSNPSAKSKIVPLNGNLYTDNLGLGEAALKTLVEDVSVVFHCAATLKLEANLKDAVEQNTAGTQRVVDVVKQIKHLDAFLHMSTAFCSADIENFEEKVYSSPHNARDVISVTQWMNIEALNKATPAIIKPHPNTYTYSKRLAECLVAEEAKNMRVAIVRPSIVIPAVKEPLPGWVDSLNGPIGLMVAGGKGVLRSMHCNGEYRGQLVPVDIAINAMIVIAYNLGSAPENPKEIPVYNFTNDGVFHVTWSRVLELGRNACYKYPFEMMIWYPDGNIRSSLFMHQLCSIFMHWLPAYLIDFLMLIFLQKRFMIRVQTKIRDGLELLQFFTTREWNFSSERFLGLKDQLDPVDKEIFHMDFEMYPLPEYLDVCVLGARHYCMKENPKSIPRCRIQQSILYVVDRAFLLILYLGLAWLLYSSIEYVKMGFDFVGTSLKGTPLLGSLVPNSAK